MTNVTLKRISKSELLGLYFLAWSSNSVAFGWSCANLHKYVCNDFYHRKCKTTKESWQPNMPSRLRTRFQKTYRLIKREVTPFCYSTLPWPSTHFVCITFGSNCQQYKCAGAFPAPLVDIGGIMLAYSRVPQCDFMLDTITANMTLRICLRSYLWPWSPQQSRRRSGRGMRGSSCGQWERWGWPSFSVAQGKSLLNVEDLECLRLIRIRNEK